MWQSLIDILKHVYSTEKRGIITTIISLTCTPSCTCQVAIANVKWQCGMNQHQPDAVLRCLLAQNAKKQAWCKLYLTKCFLCQESVIQYLVKKEESQFLVIVILAA